MSPCERMHFRSEPDETRQWTGSPRFGSADSFKSELSECCANFCTERACIFLFFFRIFCVTFGWFREGENLLHDLFYCDIKCGYLGIEVVKLCRLCRLCNASITTEAKSSRTIVFFSV